MATNNSRQPSYAPSGVNGDTATDSSWTPSNSMTGTNYIAGRNPTGDSDGYVDQSG